MEMPTKANRIRIFDFVSVPMRTFHLTWLAFFVCFFAWFAVAPLMAVVRKEMSLTDSQVGNIIIASGAITILARLLIGKLCDRFGPRITYSGLLLFGAIPVMALGLARNYETFLLLRLAIGAVGASFVITQYHTSLMFGPRCVGTANATTAGWGNMGGGAAQIAMPLLFAAIVGLGISEYWSWRLAMIVPGVAMILLSVAYFLFTKDTPQGNLADMRKAGIEPAIGKSKGSLVEAASDYRVWMLALVYAASFGLEITIHNVAALHFVDHYKVSVTGAGIIVGVFGLLAIFARTMGGWLSDRTYLRTGLRGRTVILAVSLLLQGFFLITFSQMNTVIMAVAMLVLFGLFIHTTCGATYAIIPFINHRSIGSVAGIVGAGGNLGAVCFGFLFKGGVAWTTAFLLLGILVTAVAALAWSIRFSPQAEAHAWHLRGLVGDERPEPVVPANSAA